MPRSLRDVTRDFSLGEATLEDLREAAYAERMERSLAASVLGLISEWENSAWASDRSRDTLRARAKALVPARQPVSKNRRGSESIYEAGLRGQRRRP